MNTRLLNAKHIFLALVCLLTAVCSVPVRASRSTGILPVSSMGVSPMSVTSIHGQDARVTHGRDAHATKAPDGVTTNRPNVPFFNDPLES